MNFADRVKDATTTTGTGPVTLSGTAPAGFQAFGTAFATGVQVTYCIQEQAGSGWEVGVGTLTTVTTLTRTTILASSNAGALVNFGAGTKDVFVTMPADVMRRGLVDPTDVGFDIILCAGQSNMLGNNSSESGIDVTDGRIFQFGCYPSDSASYQKIYQASDPLKFIAGGVGTGPSMAFARAYMSSIPANRRILLVPVAVGGTSVVGGTPRWNAGNPGGDLYESAISQSNLAITAAQLLYPNSRFAGAIWLQGETDADDGVTQSAYAIGLKAVIAGFRSRITGASNSFFIIGGMVPEGGRTTITAAHQQVANETARCAYAPGISGNQQGDNLHYNPQGARMLGSAMGLLVYAASAYFPVDTTPPTAASAQVANASPSVVVISMSEAMSGAYVPAASAFTVAGHTVSSVAISGSTISLTLSSAFVNGEAASTVSYTQPGTNNARDTAGNLLANFSGLAITNNVQPVDTTPPTFVSAQVANATPTVIQITMSETLASVTPAASAFTVSGGKTVSSVSISGAVISLTCSAAYANGDVITVSYTKPGTNPLHDPSGNQTASFGPSSVTNNIAAAASYLHLSQLTYFTESGAGPYIYTATNGNYGSGEARGVSTLSMAADGQVVVKTNGVGKPMVGFRTSSTLGGYGTNSYQVFAQNTGYCTDYSSVSASSVGPTNIVSAANDLMRVTRTGTTVVADISQNGGTSWTTIGTWNGATSGTLWLEILSELNGVVTIQSATGFA